MFKRHISLRKLLDGLGIAGYRIPPDFAGRFENFPVYDYNQQDHHAWIGYLTITVYPARGGPAQRKSGRHRVSTLCPTCNIETSLWKLRQHYGTKRCFKAALLRDRAAGADTVPPE